MLLPDQDMAARDLRAALATCADLQTICGYAPDATAANFARHHAGPPASGGRGDEQPLIYPQPAGPALCLGAYGGEARVRSWLTGLPQRIAPSTVAGMSAVSPLTLADADHLTLGPGTLATLPVPQVTPRDAGRYITMGFVLAEDGDGALALSAHRMLVLGPDRLGIWMLPSRQLRAMAAAAHAVGCSLPVSVNIGVPPAVAIASATSTAHLPIGFDKLSLAGALAQGSIALSAGASAGTRIISHSEIVLEGEILSETVPEALPGRPLAGSMPEFLGYDGHGQGALSVLRISSARARPGAVFQAVVGPGREQSVILGLGGALTLAFGLRNGGEAIHDLRFSHAGGGMLLLHVALRPGHGGDLAELALRIAGICPFVKTVVFVDDDVDIASDEDVLWAMTTRAQLAENCHPIPGATPLGMDPSQSPEWIAAKGTRVFKSYIDATVPASLRQNFRRSFAREPAPPSRQHLGRCSDQ